MKSDNKDLKAPTSGVKSSQGSGTDKGTDKSSKAQVDKADKTADPKAKTAAVPTPTSGTKDKPETKGSNGYGTTAAKTSSRNTSSYGSGAENANGGGYES